MEPMSDFYDGHGQGQRRQIEESITEHEGRFYWAWCDGGEWQAPTPRIGGRYVGPKDYVCSRAAVSRKRRRDLVRLLKQWAEAEAN